MFKPSKWAAIVALQVTCVMPRASVFNFQKVTYARSCQLLQLSESNLRKLVYVASQLVASYFRKVRVFQIQLLQVTFGKLIHRRLNLQKVSPSCYKSCESYTILLLLVFIYFYLLVLAFACFYLLLLAFTCFSLLLLAFIYF